MLYQRNPAAALTKILVIRLDFLGDMLCTTPLLSALRNEYPRARICVLATRYNKVILEQNSDIDQVYTYHPERNERPGRLNALLDRLRLIWRLRRERFDLILIPNGGRHAGMHCLLAFTRSEAYAVSNS